MNPPDWMRDGIVKMLREDGIPEDEIDAEADAWMESVQQPTTIWRRASDRRRPDGTGSVEFTAGASSDPNELDRLARRMAGKAGGRPPGQTALQDLDALREAVRELRRNDRRVTQENLEAYGGVTRAAIRGILKREGLTWAEFLAGS